MNLLWSYLANIVAQDNQNVVALNVAHDTERWRCRRPIWNRDQNFLSNGWSTAGLVNREAGFSRSQCAADAIVRMVDSKAQRHENGNNDQNNSSGFDSASQHGLKGT